jgi:hypothetical protein
MKNKFYFIGTVIGLICVPLVAYAILPGLFRFYDDLKILAPVGIGYLAALTIAKCFDLSIKLTRKPSLFIDPLLFVGIFLLGAVMGCLANLVINGDLLSPSFGHLEEIFDWVWKPLFYLSSFGIPCAALIGFTYTAVWRWFWARRA